MDDPSAVGGRIRAARERLGRNRNQMARDLGTSWQHVDRWERGLTAPSPASLRKLAAYLEVTVDHLLGRGTDSAGGADPPALEVFLSHYAPTDLTEAEVGWLRAAPFGERQPTPGDYVDMLHRLRTGGQGAEAGSPRTLSRRAPPKSGRQQRVDRGALLERLDAGE